MNRRIIVATAATLAALALSPLAHAQAPAGLSAGPVRITSTLPAGSGPDTIARVVAERLQAKWDRPVVVDPKPGGAGVVAINAVKGAPPTGNDLVVADVGNLAINPLIFKKLAYEPEKDLVPVALLYKTAFFVAVGANSPYKTLKDLLQAAGSKSTVLSYGSNAVGGPIHLGSARLAHALGVEMMHVPYKETSQLYAAMSTGEVDWAYASIATAGPLARAGKLRFLAVADAARSPALPEVPTLEEAGGPKGVSSLSWVGLMAPRGTPTATADAINKGVNEALSQPEAKERLATFGFVASPGPAQQVADLMQADRARYAEVLKHVKVSVD
ncbi:MULTISPECIES: tripartite tricarboxylate transporter substrate binding protein [unclassified Variovorax]|uniref:Bug family tripartite tricarboxylate transporter substrate binding protein n=1 Tax=unclassified Variovorax TaxID=663243 RepID=UPI001BD6CD0A|nr:MULTISPECIES: tripartite tricarboxylate transporter substrate binding protein [unclassified Variovorax]